MFPSSTEYAYTPRFHNQLSTLPPQSWKSSAVKGGGTQKCSRKVCQVKATGNLSEQPACSNTFLHLVSLELQESPTFRACEMTSDFYTAFFSLNAPIPC